jgi:poly-gamma-glutamate synthesis protein (capsule biosynthesis protein)
MTARPARDRTLGRDRVVLSPEASPPRPSTIRPVRLAVLLAAIVAVLGTASAAGQGVVPAGPPATVPVSPAASAQASPGKTLALVPVVGFWSPRRSVSLDALRSAFDGSDPDVEQVLVAVPEATDLAALGDVLGAAQAPTTVVASLDEIEQAIERSRRTLALVPAGDVGPSMRALAVGGATLFGGDRLRALDGWPLLVRVADPGAAPTFDPGATWTIVAAGDVMLDREVHRQAVMLGKGPDHPWDGGVSEIASRTCCTPDGGNAIRTRRTGAPGAVRALLRSADVALVNHEGPAPDEPSYHRIGFVFTFDPSLEPGLRRAGIDLVTLANNHIRNAGTVGVTETIRNLRAAGLRTVGAGRDERVARRPACFDVHAQRVCFLAYDDVNVAGVGAASGLPGAAALRLSAVTSDIRRLRSGGADVIAVLPHWGREYVARPTGRQRRQAAAMVRAGADVVLGSHSHRMGAMGTIEGVPVFYSMGDFLFDLPRFERTLEGILVELTLSSDRLVQVQLHPTVIVGRSQVDLLDPSGAADVVARMRAASAGRPRSLEPGR